MYVSVFIDVCLSVKYADFGTLHALRKGSLIVKKEFI